MTQIDFYTGTPDKLAAACQIAAKAVARGLRVLVLTPDAETTERLDRLMWCQPSTGFLPHCRGDHPLAGETPVLLDHRPLEPAHDEVLVNLRADCPPAFSRFQRLAELVGTDAADVAAGRARWRHYRERGYEINHHRLGED